MSDLTHRSLACKAHLSMLIENALYKFITITITKWSRSVWTAEAVAVYQSDMSIPVSAHSDKITLYNFCRIYWSTLCTIEGIRQFYI